MALAVAAFVIVRMLLPGPNGMLVHDLPVVVQLDVLAQVKDVEFLRGLTKIDLSSVRQWLERREKYVRSTGSD